MVKSQTQVPHLFRFDFSNLRKKIRYLITIKLSSSEYVQVFTKLQTYNPLQIKKSNLNNETMQNYIEIRIVAKTFRKNWIKPKKNQPIQEKILFEEEF